LKAELLVDPATVEAGDATPSVRAILDVVASVDWFGPPLVLADTAIERFRRHHDLAAAHRPDLFPAGLRLSAWRGSMRSFASFGRPLQADAHGDRPAGAWDWKYGQLKPLSKAHSDRHGWRIDAESCPVLFRQIAPRMVHWRQLMQVQMEHPRRDVARFMTWYQTYAEMDIHDCVEWQLAEPGALLQANPFFPLLQVYAGGYFPISHAANHVTLCAVV
jgi:hypothetical protein